MAYLRYLSYKRDWLTKNLESEMSLPLPFQKRSLRPAKHEMIEAEVADYEMYESQT